VKYRSRTEIVSRILEAADDGANKTKIMYMAFLSYVQIKEYLSMLVNEELLEYDQKTQTYRTTEKGRKTIKVCKALDKFLAIKNEVTEIQHA
jgi:predicted transcriptional regulator